MVLKTGDLLPTTCIIMYTCLTPSMHAVQKCSYKASKSVYEADCSRANKESKRGIGVMPAIGIEKREAMSSSHSAWFALQWEPKLYRDMK